MIGIGQRLVRLQPGMTDRLVRRTVQRFQNARLGLLATLLGGGEPFLGTGALLAA